MRRPHAGPQRWQRFRPRRRRFQLGQDRLERVEPRRQRVAGFVERATEQLDQRAGLVIGKVERHPRNIRTPRGRLVLGPTARGRGIAKR
jgi:hypothetical protein